MSEAKRFEDLPDRTKEFLSNLRDDEIDTMNDGIRLVSAMRTVAVFFKWLLVGVGGMILGTVMLGESIVKIAAWLRG